MQFSVSNVVDEQVRERTRRKRVKKLLAVASLFIVFLVFWKLMLPGITATRQNGLSIEFDKFITGITLEHRQNEWDSWKPVENGKLNGGDEVRFTINYTIPKDVLNKDNNTVNIHYELPTEVDVIINQSGVVMNSSGNIIGTYAVNTSGMIEIAFDEEYCDGNAIDGGITFVGQFNENLQTDENVNANTSFGNVNVSINVGDKEQENKKDFTIIKEATS